MEAQIITWGSISKQEVLKTLESNIIPNSMVLESMEPFPGYHGKNIPTDAVPGSVFLITLKQYTDEEILRLREKINESFKTPFNATPALITLYNEQYPSIRIWNLEGYDYIVELQEKFKNEGVEFRKKKNIKDVALIQIKKTFRLVRDIDGIYYDNTNEKMYYIEIPQISWNLFEKITKNIKNNVDNNNFDAALGMFYMDKIVDVVRIFGKEIDKEQLKILKNKYNREIRDFFA